MADKTFDINATQGENKILTSLQGRDTETDALSNNLLDGEKADYEIEQADPKGNPLNRGADRKAMREGEI